MSQVKPFIFDRANLPFVNGESRSLGNWKDIGIFTFITPLLVGFMLYILVLAPWLHQLRIDQDYGVVEAEITDGYSLRRMLLFVSYNLNYVYQIDDAVYTGQQSVGDLWNQVGIGDRLNVRYSISDPSQSYIEGETIFAPGRLIWTLLAFAISAFMLFGIFIMVYSAMSHRRVLQNGTRIMGKLNSVKETKVAKGGIVAYDVVFEFTTPDGVRIESKKAVSDSVIGAYRPPPEPGTPVLILYQNEKRYLLL